MATPSAVLGSISTKLKRQNPDVIFDRNKRVEFLPTGNLSFDLNSGGGKMGGIPRGRITEIFGMEHSGKSSLMYKFAATTQRTKAGRVVFLDHENAFDVEYAERTYGLKVDQDTFILLTPDNIEEADVIFEQIKDLDNLVAIIHDSVDAMKPKALIESSLSDERRVGAQAQAVGRYVAKMRAFCRKSNCAAIFLNQMRVTINTNRSEQNVGTGSGFNPMETHTTPGGYSLRFYASLRVKLEYGGKIDDEGGNNAVSGESEKTRAGNKIKIVNIKNKVGTPFIKTMTTFLFPTKDQKGGWSRKDDLMAFLKGHGIVRQAATKFIYEGLSIKWSNVGSKADSEALFFKDPARCKDAEETLLACINGTIASKKEALEAAAAQAFMEVGSKESAAQEEAAAITTAVQTNVERGTHVAGTLDTAALEIELDEVDSETDVEGGGNTGDGIEVLSL